MTRVTTAFAAAFALFLPIGRPLLVGLAPAVGIGAGLLSTRAAFAQSAQDWFDSGVAKFERGDLQGAIADYTKAIEINPSNAGWYFLRGFAKSQLYYYKGAIDDYTKAIEIDPLDKYFYSGRAANKLFMGDLQGACSDWRKAADLGHVYAIEWVRNEC